MTDPRAQVLVLFQKLSKELSTLNEQATLKRAADLIVNALQILPDFSVEKTEKEGEILIRKLDTNDAPVKLNIQDAADGLITLWREYQDAVDRE